MIEFDNWIMMEMGRRAPMAYHYGRRKLLASYGHFRGLNVMRYLNGSVGPRPPFTDLHLLLDSAHAIDPGYSESFFGPYWVGGVNKVVMLMTSGDVWESDVPSCACVNGIGIQVGSVDVVSTGNPDIGMAAFIDPVSRVIAPITGQPVCN